MKHIDDYFTELEQEVRRAKDNSIGQLGKIADRIYKAYESDQTIFIAGNGGSAATASHAVCDLSSCVLKDREDPKEKRLRVHALTDATPIITATGNDVGYENIFYQQLLTHMRERDLLIAVSASGNSPNIVKAVDYVQGRGGEVIGFSGFDGGKLREKANYGFHVPNHDYAIVEDMHMMAINAIARDIKERKKHE